MTFLLGRVLSPFMWYFAVVVQRTGGHAPWPELKGEPWRLNGDNTRSIIEVLLTPSMDVKSKC